MSFRCIAFLVAVLMGAHGVSGCVSMLFGPPEVKSDEYDFITPQAPWTKIDPGTSDVAFQHLIDRATISLNSVCDQYQDLSLDELSASLSLGLDDIKDQSLEKIQVDNLPALRRTVSGQAGPEKMTVSYTVLRSPHCVYDFILVARSASFSSHRPTYDEEVAQFHERKKP